MKRIGIVSIYDPHNDKKAHSGILYRINQAVENAGFETVWIRNSKPLLYIIICKLIGLLGKIRFLKGLHFNRTWIGVKLMSSTLDTHTIETCDYLLVLHYYHVPACLSTKVPIIYHSDTTFDIAHNYYLNNLPKWIVKQAEEIEQKALDKVTFHLSPSKWRHDSIVNHYSQPPSHCFLLEYGPCIDFDNPNKVTYNKESIHLLFSGVDWTRKGGDIAVETTKILNERGIKCTLTIIGLIKKPEICKNKNYINFQGYLNKNDKLQYERLISIYNESDLFILPTHAEGAGIVFCESSYLGLPAITYDTGGIANYVVNGINGYRLPEGASAQQFADKIEEMIAKSELPKLSVSAKKYAMEKLNWENWTLWFRNNLK